MTGINYLIARGPQYDIPGAFQQGVQQGQQANALALATQAARSGDYGALSNALLQLGDTRGAMQALETPYERQRQKTLDEQARQQNELQRKRQAAMDALNRRNIESEIQGRNRPQRDLYAERAAAAGRFGLQEGTPDYQAFVLYGQAPKGADGAFPGQGAEVAGINEMIRLGKITKEQGARYLAGKTVTGPGGELNFITPTDVFPEAAPPAAPAPVAPPGNAFGPRDPRYAPSPLQSPVRTPMPVAAAPSPAAPAAAPSPGVQLRPANAQPPPKVVSDAQSVDRAYNALSTELDNYKDLIKKTGVVAMPGQNADLVQSARTNLQLLAKELFNLGVLNGPDLSLMENLIFDPQVSPYSPLDAASKIYSGATGGLDKRIDASIDQFKSQLKNKRDASVKGIIPQTKGSGEQRKTSSGIQWSVE